MKRSSLSLLLLFSAIGMEGAPPGQREEQIRRQLHELIPQLDAKTFSKREAASRRLAQLGQEAIPLIKERMKSPVSAEVRHRFTQSLNEYPKRVYDFTAIREGLVRSLTAHPEFARQCDELNRILQYFSADSKQRRERLEQNFLASLQTLLDLLLEVRPGGDLSVEAQTQFARLYRKALSKLSELGELYAETLQGEQWHVGNLRHPTVLNTSNFSLDQWRVFHLQTREGASVTLSIQKSNEPERLWELKISGNELSLIPSMEKNTPLDVDPSAFLVPEQDTFSRYVLPNGLAVLDLPSLQGRFPRFKVLARYSRVEVIFDDAKHKFCQVTALNEKGHDSDWNELTERYLMEALSLVGDPTPVPQDHSRLFFELSSLPVD